MEQSKIIDMLETYQRRAEAEVEEHRAPLRPRGTVEDEANGRALGPRRRC